MKSIFVSSTFRDMQAERDALVLNVVPGIDTYAANFGQNIRFVDLRWGVNTTDMNAEESSRKVLKVCLDEIDKTRPYMIILIGERYGWIPEDKELMHRVAKEKGHELKNAEKSVTELEIEYGALGEKGLLENCLFYFREPLPQEIIPQDVKGAYIEKDAELENKLQNLKQRIKSAGGKIKHYTARWNEEKKALDIPRNFCEMVENDVKALFDAEFKETENLLPIEREQIFAMLFAQQKALQFAARFDLLRLFTSLIMSQDKNLLLIRGAPGSGKSTIMSKLAVDLIEKANVFFFSCGNTSLSQTVFDIVRGAVYYTETLLGKIEHYGEGENEKKHTFAEWASLLENLCGQYGEKYKKPLLFFIDALDQLAQDEDTRALKFLPYVLPPNVTFIVSALSDYETREMHPLHDRCAKEEILPLHDEQRAKVVYGILETYSKQLNKGVVDALIAAEGATNPLYISMMIQRLIMLDSDDFGVIAQFGNDMNAINKFLVDTINSTPNTVEEMSAEVLREAAHRINEDMIHVAALIATSRRGLREKDLAEIFKLGGKNWLSVDFASYIKYLKPFFIQRHDGRLDFTHRTIRLGFLNQIDFKKYNAQILTLLKQTNLTDSLRISETIYHALKQEDYKFAIEHVADIDLKCRAKNGTEISTTADEMYAMSVTEARYVDMLLFAFNKSTDKFKTRRNCNFFNFVINDFYNTFGDSDLEKDLLVMFLERIVISAQNLTGQFTNNEKLDTNLFKCYAELAKVHSWRNIYDDLLDIDFYDSNLAYLQKCKDAAVTLVKQYNTLKSRLNFFEIYYKLEDDCFGYASLLNMSATELEFQAIKTYEKLVNCGYYNMVEMYCNYCMRFAQRFTNKSIIAAKIVKEAYELTKNLHSTKGIGTAQYVTAALNLAYIYYRANMLSTAQPYFLEALGVCEELVRLNSSAKNYLLYAKTLRYYGLCLSKGGMSKQAIEHHTKSIEISDKYIITIGNYECYIALARSYEYRADCHGAIGNREKAIEDYKECYKLADIITHNFPVNEMLTEEQRISDIFDEKFGRSELGFVSVISEEKLEKEQVAVKNCEYIAKNFDEPFFKARLISKYVDLAYQFERFRKYEQMLQIQYKIAGIYRQEGGNLPEDYPGQSKYNFIKALNSISSTLDKLEISDGKIEVNEEIVFELAKKIDSDDFCFNEYIAVSAITALAHTYSENEDFVNSEKYYKEGLRLFQKVIDNYERVVLSASKEVLLSLDISENADESKLKRECESKIGTIEEVKTDMYKPMTEMYIKAGRHDDALKYNKLKIDYMLEKYTYEDKETGETLCAMYSFKNFEIVGLYKKRADIFRLMGEMQNVANALSDAVYFHMVDKNYSDGARKNAKRAKEYSELCDEYIDVLKGLGMHEHAKMHEDKKADVLTSFEKHEAENAMKAAKEGTRKNPIIKKHTDKDGKETGAYMRIYENEEGKEIIEIIDY